MRLTITAGARFHYYYYIIYWLSRWKKNQGFFLIDLYTSYWKAQMTWQSWRGGASLEGGAVCKPFFKAHQISLSWIMIDLLSESDWLFACNRYLWDSVKSCHLANYFFNFTTLGFISKLLCETPNLRILFASAWEGGRERPINQVWVQEVSTFPAKKRPSCENKKNPRTLFT